MLKGTLPKFSPASRPQTPEDDKSRRPILSLARSPHLPSPRLTAFALLFLLFLYFILSSTAPAALTTGAARFPSKGEPRNWGDYVGQGLARAKLLAETPPRYADLSDRYHSGSKGPFYRGRTSELQKPAPIPKAVAASIEGKKSKKAAAAVAAVPAADSGSLGDFETERRGVLGGASREWSTGVVGMGDWLGGTVDMRKLPLPVGESTASDKSARAGLAAHILESAWTFKDAEDEANTNALLTDARLNNFLETLPLRDRVRDDPAASAKAAEMWSSVYGALEGDSTKSALEVAIEKLVRRVPVVIFSKVTCPYVQSGLTDSPSS